MSRPCAPTPTTRADVGSGRAEAAKRGQDHGHRLDADEVGRRDAADRPREARRAPRAVRRARPGRFMPTDCRATQADVQPRRH